MKRFLATTGNDISEAFSQSLRWAVPATEKISVAVAIDDGGWDERELANLLSDAEIHRSASIVDSVERRHFMYRRSFQRVFLKGVLKWPGRLDHISIEHQQDTQPVCLDSPQYKLSFSSSAAVFLAGASDSYLIGVDLEKVRPVENAVALALRFFTAREAKVIESLAVADRDVALLKIWTAKEAGLKAIGRGIVSGLNSFVVRVEEGQYAIEVESDLSPDTTWQLEYADFLPDHIVAVVHRADK